MICSFSCSTSWQSLPAENGCPSHQLCEAGKGQTAAGKATERDRPARPLSRHSNQTSTPESARFNQLPGNESRDNNGEFAHSCDQRQGEGRIPGDAEKVAYEKITAFLDAQTSRHRKSRRPNRQHHALQDERVNERRVKIERVKRDPNFAGASDQRNNRPHTTHHDCTPPRVKRANSPIERLAALH